MEQHQPQAIVMRCTTRGFLREVYEGIEAEIPLPFLDCRLALQDIYRGVEFSPICVQELEVEYEVRTLLADRR